MKINKILAVLLSISFVISGVLNMTVMAEENSSELPAGKLLHEQIDTLSLKVFSPSSEIKSGDYYLNDNKTYSGSVKYKTNTTTYGQGCTFNHSSENGALWGSDTNTVTTFYDLILDGGNVLASAVPFNADVKASTWTLDNVLLRNYDAGQNSIFRVGTTSVATLNLSNFKIDETNNASSSIHMYPNCKGTVNLGKNISIPIIFITSSENNSLVFKSDFTGSVGISIKDELVNVNGSTTFTNPVATVESGADISAVTAINENVELTLSDGKLYAVSTVEPTPPPSLAFDKGTVTVGENGVLIIADYDENSALVQLQTQNVTAGQEIRVPGISGRKFMLWDGMGTMKPLAEAIQIPGEAPEASSSLYVVYTTDGTADGEISRTKISSGNKGDVIQVPASVFAARKIADTDGLYDIYSCIDGDRGDVTLQDGDNFLYVTVKHEDGKYYYWEDFESYNVGAMNSSDMWNHGGVSTVSSIINCSTDTYNTSNAARWWSNNTGAAREKIFKIVNSALDVPEGEKLVFSADIRMGLQIIQAMRTV